MITKLVIFDFDGTLSNSPKPEGGIEQWEKAKGVKYTHDDWWGRPESLDPKVFNIKLFPSIVNILNKEKSNPNTLVIILSSRIEKLRPYLKNILKQNNVSVKSLELKTDERTKGEKVLDFINKFPQIKQVDVYDDRNKEIKTYLSIVDNIPEDIVFNIYVVSNGNISKYNNTNLINESMTAITLRYKPQFLPQVSAPYTEVVDNLALDGVGYEMATVDPNELKPIQGITLSHNVENVNLDDEKPIWISKDMEVLDGLHRMTKAIFQNRPIRCVKINLNSKDACRVLNKIQDLFDHKKEVETDKENNMEFLERIEQTKSEPEEVKTDPVKIIAYRKDNINPNSVIGNFFSLKPLKDALKFEIEFDNLLDTNTLGLTFMDGQIPVDILAKTWFPHLDFEKLALEHNTDSIKLKNRAVAEKAKKMGYDGIMYGDKLLQGL